MVECWSRPTAVTAIPYASSSATQIVFLPSTRLSVSYRMPEILTFFPELKHLVRSARTSSLCDVIDVIALSLVKCTIRPVLIAVIYDLTLAFAQIRDEHNMFDMLNAHHFDCITTVHLGLHLQPMGVKNSALNEPRYVRKTAPSCEPTSNTQPHL